MGFEEREPDQIEWHKGGDPDLIGEALAHTLKEHQAEDIANAYLTVGLIRDTSGAVVGDTGEREIRIRYRTPVGGSDAT
jgi:hypothetical protein